MGSRGWIDESYAAYIAERRSSGSKNSVVSNNEILKTAGLRSALWTA